MEKFKNIAINILKKAIDFVKPYYEKYISFDRKKRIYIIATVFIVCIIFWAFISSAIITVNLNRDNLKGTEDEQRVDAASIIITETKDGKKYFEIYGENGDYNNDDNIATLNNVVGNFYKDNEVAMSFQSSKGTYDEKQGIVTLYENTYIVLKDNTSLSSNRLIWSGSDKDTIAEGNVKIKKENEMIALADKCIIGAGYDKFKIIGKTQTKIYGNKE